MHTRCIMIFPQFNNMEIIDRIREKYDPLADKVRPHITLVFPFASDLSKHQMKEHIELAVSEIGSFSLTLQRITPANGNYLFLNVVEGKGEIMKLHQLLYQGILEDYYPNWLKNIKYVPHMTVGKLENDNKFAKALEEAKGMEELFTTIVDRISVEIIGENDESIIEMEIPLNN